MVVTYHSRPGQKAWAAFVVVGLEIVGSVAAGRANAGAGFGKNPPTSAPALAVAALVLWQLAGLVMPPGTFGNALVQPVALGLCFLERLSCGA